MTGRVLLGWTRIHDADSEIVYMLREPVRFGKQLWVRVPTLMEWDYRHGVPPIVDYFFIVVSFAFNGYTTRYNQDTG
jgi:hypothetical protein